MTTLYIFQFFLLFINLVIRFRNSETLSEDVLQCSIMKVKSKGFVSLRDCMVCSTSNVYMFIYRRSSLQFQICLITLSVITWPETDVMSLLATCIGMYYVRINNPCRNTWRKSKCVMSTDSHLNIVNCWQSRSRSYSVIESTVLHLQWTFGFTIQFPWG